MVGLVSMVVCAVCFLITRYNMRRNIRAGNRRMALAGRAIAAWCYVAFILNAMQFFWAK